MSADDRATEERLPGERLHGAVRVGETVRKPGGPWTPAVHALLRHLEDVGFNGHRDPSVSTTPAGTS